MDMLEYNIGAWDRGHHTATIYGEYEKEFAYKIQH